MPSKPKEMITGPEAFENFKRLMKAMLLMPKEAAADAKPTAKRKRKAIR
jgi:hypothetical protein